MKKILLLSFFTMFLVSCGTTRNTSNYPVTEKSNIKLNKKSIKNTTVQKNNTLSIEEPEEETFPDSADDKLEAIKHKIISYAKTFEGTRYKFGGTTEAGMDCSGLVCVAFEKENISLPRISRDMATKGIPVTKDEVEEGDLVFFKTSRRNTINHVGIIVEAIDGEIKFIHSSTSAGVIISSLNEAYWKKAFVSFRRVLEI
ncbi:C40 family peptidase [Aequorivita xiaoshiensis]|uniref:C40 family peptidase n=1 Tax=Aequorivita xiaoshiensis TaxID=2874476 RepID=A0A9X1U6S3_9FLAO|nr:C40 family peptidase [Aequorivita xiaoshiensis]MCG2431502.1 C40 family peptidase [Aequorivita xiaoshiensis]